MLQKAQSDRADGGEQTTTTEACPCAFASLPSKSRQLCCFHLRENLHRRSSKQHTKRSRVCYLYGTIKKQVPANQLLRTRFSFSQSVMVSVGVSALGRTIIHFVEPGVKVKWSPRSLAEVQPSSRHPSALRLFHISAGYALTLLHTVHGTQWK